MPQSAIRTRRVARQSASRSRGTPFKAIEPPARVLLSDSIVSQIENLIVQGVLKPGDRLPPERELAEQLSVSRPSLREATLKLEARGLVHARRGGGYHVADVTAPTLTDPLVHLLQEHPPASYDILELRQGLEEKAAYLAAQRRTDADLRILKRRFAALVESDRARGNAISDAEADLEFHLAIADASHNVALVHVMHGLFNLLRTSTYRFRELVFTMGDGTEKLLNGQHRAIYEAVVKGDANAARDAIHLHLSFIDASLREAELPRLERQAARGRARRAGVIKHRATKARGR
jgi:GntR family transcriptional repressor for pyruvate dehydrogenase complex